ncbi:glutaminyl-peptide cyclotransferase [Genypterus blacodes]|uniref:glutaminyl-peptide cyclotransferase n=1 Tax=Genypterus blacodes TaxID=154954 RepID=UPI003F76CD67
MRRGEAPAMAQRRRGPSVTRLCSAVTVWLLLIQCVCGVPWTQEKLRHTAITLTPEEISSALSHTDLDVMWQRDLKPLLVTRYPGSPGSLVVQQHIQTNLSSLGAGWEVVADQFQDTTPYGPLPFTNIIATLNPSAKRRLVLACHFDSKYYPPQWSGEFVGATDSAVSCSMMLELARALDEELKAQKTSSPDLTLQLIFFDGEEALFRWNDADSLYGSRHMAKKMAATPHPAGPRNANLLHGIDLFVLLDLIGAPNPRFGNHFPNTLSWLSRLQNIERRLHATNHLQDHPSEAQYFWPNVPVGLVQDDHLPFLDRGVRILHLIPSPFPSVWHKFEDNEENLDRASIGNLNKIMQVFVLEYLNARPQVPSNPQNAP